MALAQPIPNIDECSEPRGLFKLPRELRDDIYCSAANPLHFDEQLTPEKVLVWSRRFKVSLSFDAFRSFR
jgi:hypothetical protein